MNTHTQVDTEICPTVVVIYIGFITTIRFVFSTCQYSKLRTYLKVELLRRVILEHYRHLDIIQCPGSLFTIGTVFLTLAGIEYFRLNTPMCVQRFVEERTNVSAH